MLSDTDDFVSIPRSGKAVHPYDRGAAGRVVVLMLTVGAGGLIVALIGGSDFDGLILYVGLAILSVLTLLIYLYMLAAWKRSIEVDYDQCVVVLRHMVYPVRFWDVLPKSEARIPFSEIRGVEVMHGNALSSFIIHTTRSRFVFSEHFENADGLVSRLESIATGNPELSPFRRFHIVVMTLTAGVIAGAFIVAAGIIFGWL